MWRPDLYAGPESRVCSECEGFEAERQNTRQHRAQVKAWVSIGAIRLSRRVRPTRRRLLASRQPLKPYLIMPISRQPSASSHCCSITFRSSFQAKATTPYFGGFRAGAFCRLGQTNARFLMIYTALSRVRALTPYLSSNSDNAFRLSARPTG